MSARAGPLSRRPSRTRSSPRGAHVCSSSAPALPARLLRQPPPARLVCPARLSGPGQVRCMLPAASSNLRLSRSCARSVASCPRARSHGARGRVHGCGRAAAGAGGANGCCYVGAGLVTRHSARRCMLAHTGVVPRHACLHACMDCLVWPGPAHALLCAAASPQHSAQPPMVATGPLANGSHAPHHHPPPPFHATPRTRVALQRGILSAHGKTPDATMASALYTDVKKKGTKSLFMRYERGQAAAACSRSRHACAEARAQYTRPHEVGMHTRHRRDF